jgi:hypothetical protein
LIAMVSAPAPAKRLKRAWKAGHSRSLSDSTDAAPACPLADSGGTRTDSRNRTRATCKEITMTLGTILLIVLVLMLIGAIPTWPHSRGWGYGPSGGLGLVVVILLVLVLLGYV